MSRKDSRYIAAYATPQITEKGNNIQMVIIGQNKKGKNVRVTVLLGEWHMPSIFKAVTEIANGRMQAKALYLDKLKNAVQ